MEFAFLLSSRESVHAKLVCQLGIAAVLPVLKSAIDLLQRFSFFLLFLNFTLLLLTPASFSVPSSAAE